jgi:non-specific serine/threonine protein kinase
MTTNFLHIRLLGDFRLLDGDTQVTKVNSPRMQSLLAYLLLHRDAPQPRYHIAFLLWPDSPEAQARSNLRNLLFRLRHAFPGIETFLQEDAQQLCWQVDAPFTLDTADFEMAIAEAKRAEATGDQDALRTSLERSVELYNGDLLPSCYDEWILLPREHLHQAFLEALEKLSVLQENQGQYRQAIHSAQRLLRYDPLQESIYRRLMQLYALTGDRTGALRIYQTCTTVLKRELDIEPDAVTRSVYKSLLVAQAKPTGGAHTKTAGSLPDRLTSFIGREREIADVKRLLSSTHLLTLTGPFGAGKTRLGLEVADQLTAEGRFPDGVGWIELAPLNDPKLVPQAIAAAVNIREKPGEPLVQSLIGALQNRSLLLLLDNCEHLITACSGTAVSLLRACPRLRILATSREALGVMGEVNYPVSSLAFPSGGEGKQKKDTGDLPVGAARSARLEEAGQILQFEAVRLFVERAMTVLPTFQLNAWNAPAVAQVCRRLEGLPLAIELAAAQVRMMSVEQIAARLDDALPLLKANWEGELLHHQTMHAAIDWSYTLLNEKEQALLRRLSVFAGGFSLEAAEQVAPLCLTAGTEAGAPGFSSSEVLDLLSSLIDKSLVVVVEREQGSEVRYRLLEIVRQYARKRLSEAAELEAALCSHANFFLALVEESAPELRGAEQETWLHRLDLERDNLRAALAWSTGPSGSAEIGLRLAGDLWQYWDVRGDFSEGRQWLGQILANPSARSMPRAKALKAAGGLAWGQGDFASARSCMTIYALDQGDYTGAHANFEKTLALRREIGDKRGVAVALGNLGVVAWRQGNCLAARPLLQESLERYQEIGDRRGAGTSLNELGQVALQMGELDRAYSFFRESLAVWQELGNKEGIALFLEGSTGLACSWVILRARRACSRLRKHCANGPGCPWPQTNGSSRIASGTASTQRCTQIGSLRCGPKAGRYRWKRPLI